MLPQSKYIGPTRTYVCPITNESIELVENENYFIDIRLDGPRIIINGQPTVTPDSTYWLVFDNGRIQIPYSPQAIAKQWEGLFA